jgi:hypothetical protein
MAVYRDRQILALAAGLLRETNQFALVTTSGLPEVQGQPAEAAALASLELDGFDEEKFADEPVDSFSYTRTVRYTLTLIVRNSDPDARDDEVDRLAAVCGNALVGENYGGETIETYSTLAKGTYLAAAAPERRLKLTGQFAYDIEGRTARNADA